MVLSRSLAAPVRSGADRETTHLKGLSFGEILPVAIPQPVVVGEAKLGMGVEECGHRRFRGQGEEEVCILPFRPDAEQAFHVDSRRTHAALEFIYIEELLWVHRNSYQVAERPFFLMSEETAT
jgi:hypothetical protein